MARFSRLKDGLSFTVEFLHLLLLISASVMKSAFRWIVRGRYKDITEDVVLITGGGRGIGRQLAVEFAQHRPRQIILWGRTEEPLKATCKAVEMHGVSCKYMVCDVGDREQVYQKADEVRERFGDVTIVVNNAGIVYGQTILESDDEDIRHTFDVNVMAHFWEKWKPRTLSEEVCKWGMVSLDYVVKAFLPRMLEQDHGHIVTMSSLLGYMGMPGAADYCATKFATIGFSESLALEISSTNKTGVHVTSVHPYVINTDMFAGIKSRFDWLVPPLDKEYVAWKTLDALLTNQAQVVMPCMMYFFIICKSILPVEALHVIFEYIGFTTAMDTFHGRQKSE